MNNPALQAGGTCYTAHMTTPLRIGVAGCTGRMGLMLLRAATETDGFVLAAGSVRPGMVETVRPDLIAQGFDPDSFALVDSTKALVDASDAVIDFTTPGLTLQLAEEVANQDKMLVSGTTGLASGQQKQFEAFAQKARIVWAANMSVGVTLLQAVVKQVAAVLDEEYDIEVYEMHHRMKQDAPSGTALALGRAAADGRDTKLQRAGIFAREGHTGPRTVGTIGFAVSRGGEVIGDHTVTFAGPGERIELSHKASDRMIYAHGALRAARWLQDQQPGLYSMNNVLGM